MPGEVLKKLLDGYRYKETLPTKFDSNAVANTARAAALGKVFGMPEIGITSLLNRMLVEGREDAGVNGFNANNKQAEALYELLVSKGVPNNDAMYPAAVLDKSQVAKRLGISFDEAWNGTGRSGSSGNTGKDYATRSKQMSAAAQDPRNSVLADYINRAMNDKLTPREKLNNTDQVTLIKKLFGNNDAQTDLLEDQNSNLSVAVADAVKKITGKNVADIPIDPKDPLTPTRPIVYQATAVDILDSIIRAKAGVTYDANPQSWIKNSPELQTVFNTLADQAIKSLGIDTVASDQSTTKSKSK